MSESVIATDSTSNEKSKETLSETWYDADKGVLNRKIFTDEQVYQQELTHIFGRSWNFMCHESQIPEPGCYFTNYIGEDEVITVRDRQGKINVLINSCPHRGNTVCRAEKGKTRSFFCSYHGWNFDLDGTLVGMPGEEQFYRNGIDKTQWGLSKVAKVQSYKGFVFATLDEQAPDLENYLGWVGRLGIDTLAGDGKIKAVDGVQKFRIKCNWKLAVDNLYDWYHVKASHSSALRIGFVDEDFMAFDSQLVVLGEYGHGIGGPGLSHEHLQEYLERQASGKGDPQWYDIHAEMRKDKSLRDELGSVGTMACGHPNIFPNLWVTLTKQVCLRIPKGPLETELWWFTFVPEDVTEEERQFMIFRAQHVFGPAGLLEQDDGENWSHSTRGAKGTYAKTLPLNYAMGMGTDEVEEDASGQTYIRSTVNEHGQRWTYQSWQEWMHASSWPDLIKHHSSAPKGKI